MSTPNTCLRALLACLIISVMIPVVKGAIPAQDQKSEAEKLLREAHERTDIRATDGRPFRLTAIIELLDEQGQTKQGNYRLFWESPTKWQDELTFPDFSQTRLASGEKLFTQRKPIPLTMEMFRLLHFLEFPDSIRPALVGTPTNVKEVAKEGKQETAIKTEVNDKVWWTFYVEKATSVPSQVESASGKTRLSFEKYEEFAGHLFPRLLIETRSNQMSIRVQVQELTGANYKPETFAPPPDAPYIRWCPNAVPAKPLHQRDSVFIPIPWPLRNGTALKKHAVFYGIIGTDGVWQNLTVVKSAGREADDFWRGTLVRERFTPAMCGNEAVVEEMVQELFMP